MGDILEAILMSPNGNRKGGMHPAKHPSSFSVKKSHTLNFNAIDIQRLHEYLIRYRDVSIQYCENQEQEYDIQKHHDNEETDTLFSYPLESAPDESEGEWIGGYLFPPLNSITCTQPYLTLPWTLTNKHRKMIHELCVDIDGLYHIAVGEKKYSSKKSSDGTIVSEKGHYDPADATKDTHGNEATNETFVNQRRILVSIFADGFEYVLVHNMENPKEMNRRCYIHQPAWLHVEKPTSFPLLQCKSWFYRNDHMVFYSALTQNPFHDHGTIPWWSKLRSYWLHPSSPSIFANTTTSISSPLTTSWWWREDFSSTKSSITSHIYIQEETKKGIRAIHELIDQPSFCIRDTWDSIDLDPLESMDLSQDVLPYHQFLDANQNPFDSDSFFLVDTVDKMKTCVYELTTAQPPIHVMAFDLEAYNQSKYSQATCLLQLSSNVGKDYVIDVLAPGVWDQVSLLQPLFSDPAIVKVGHGIAGMDISSLHRDFGLFVVNAFDTLAAAEALNMKEHLSLAKLCDFYGLPNSHDYKTLKNDFQITDWRKRPLTTSMIAYGLCDVHFLVKLRLLLIRDLIKREILLTLPFCNKSASNEIQRMNRIAQADEGDTLNDTDSSAIDTAAYFDTVEEDLGGDENPVPDQCENGFLHESIKKSFFDAKDLRMNSLLMSVLSKSQGRCLGIWKGRNESPEQNETFIHFVSRSRQKGNKYTPWTHANMILYRLLVEWRERLARHEGLNPSMIVSLDLLVLIAYKRPRSLAELRRLSYFLPELLEKGANGTYLIEVFAIISSSSGQDLSSTSNIATVTFQTRMYSDFTTRHFKKKSRRAPKETSLDDKSNDSMALEIPLNVRLWRWALISGVVVFCWVRFNQKRTLKR